MSRGLAALQPPGYGHLERVCTRINRADELLTILRESTEPLPVRLSGERLLPVQRMASSHSFDFARWVQRAGEY